MRFDPLAATPPARAPLLVALAAAAILGAAYIAEYGFGLEPCRLCLWQRYPYMAAVGLGLTGALLAARPRVRRGLLALAALAFVVAAGLAGFHVGVEQGWWPGLPGCSAPAIRQGMSVAELRAVLEAHTQVVPCDEPAWTFLGLSLAAYNLLAALALAAATALALRR